jgi:serine/threonine protein kinase
MASGLDALHNLNSTTLGSHENHRGRAPIQQSKSGRLRDRSTEEKFGTHGKLKAQSILWFSETANIDSPGILQIAGFTQARLHRLESRSRVDPITMDASSTCSPAEAILGKPVSRAYDIWSLGCIFLEFIIWLLEGSEGTDCFAKAGLKYAGIFDNIADNCFYTPRYLESGRSPAFVEIRESVTAWIKHLHQNQPRSSMADELLDLISQQMLNVIPSERIRSDKLTSELGRILERATENSEYLIGTNPPEEDIGAGIKKPQTWEPGENISDLPVRRQVGYHPAYV